MVSETNDREIRVAFGLAESLHSNFYEVWLEREDVEDYLGEVDGLVGKRTPLPKVRGSTSSADQFNDQRYPSFLASS